MFGAIWEAICNVAGALNNEIVVLISWDSRLVRRLIVEYRAQTVELAIELIAGEATSDKQHARIFRTVGE